MSPNFRFDGGGEEFEVMGRQDVNLRHVEMVLVPDVDGADRRKTRGTRHERTVRIDHGHLRRR